MKLAAFVLLVASVIATVTCQDATIYCPLCSTHTMCTYPTEGVLGAACAPALNRTVSTADIAVILNAHNTLRNKVASGSETLGAPGPQPSASNMRYMEWDDELARVAQRWADQCMYGHDTCRKVSRFLVGQNVAEQSSTASSTTPDWGWPVNAWYNEVSLYSNANINPYVFAGTTGHYTQVAWAQTYKVGCGYMAYKTSPSDVWYNRFYVCNYGPTGNMGGEALYATGTKCSACPTGTACDTTFTGLCRTVAAATTTTTPATTTTTKPTTTTTKPTTTTTKPTTTTTKPTTTTTTTTTTKPTTTTTKPTTTTTTTTTTKPTTTTTKPTTTTTTTTTTKPTTTTTKPTTTTTKPTTTTTTPPTTTTTKASTTTTKPPTTTTPASTTGTPNSYCIICADHTMCKFTLDGAGPQCLPSIARTVSAADKVYIVDYHNKLRNKVALGLELQGAPGAQPNAADMLKISWDNELAAVAQRWADQCTYAHDTCRSVSRFYVGQNIAMWSSSVNNATADWTWPIQAWYDEVSLYSNANINPFSFGSGTGHYTQVVWSRTKFVGCGYASYKTSPTDVWYNRYFVCNYGPGGNYIGQPLYTAGLPCSSCPTGTTCDTTYTGLCV